MYGEALGIYNRNLYEGTKYEGGMFSSVRGYLKSVVDAAAKEDKRKLLEVKKRQKLDLLAE